MNMNYNEVIYDDYEVVYLHDCKEVKRIPADYTEYLAFLHDTDNHGYIYNGDDFKKYDPDEMFCMWESKELLDEFADWLL